MGKPFLHFIIILVTCLACFWNSTAQENYEVRNISFQGNKTLSKDYLLEKIAISEVSYLEKVFTKKEPFLYNEELITQELDLLKRTYQSEGFLYVKTNIQPFLVKNKKQTLKLSIEIEEGNPVLIDSMAIHLIDESDPINMDSLTNKVLRNLELVQGSRFRDAALTNDIQIIENAFRNLGYAYVEVSYKLNLNPDQYLVGISYTVDPGPVCYLAETTISGNKNISESFILKQIEYKKNGVYNKSLLDETRRNLYQFQLFKVVSVLPGTDIDTKINHIPINIYIEEAPRVSTQFGVGYGTEDKFRTFMDLNYRGFLGGAQRINLYLKHSALEPYSASLRWIHPQFFGKNSTIALNPFINRNSEPGYDIRTYGINLPITYRFNDQLNSTATYYIMNVKQQVEVDDPTIEDMEDDKFLYNKSGILISTVFNNSTPKFSPTKGQILSLGFKLNGHLFGSDFNYTRLWGDFRTYQTFGKGVFAYRIMAGGISSADNSEFIPVEDRFYSGGSNSIRGWSRSELGPKRDSGTPSGGKSIIESNVEIRYPLIGRLSGVTFLDVGNVWTKSFTYKMNELAYAAGLGLRIETPIGPIRFDAGLPLWNEKKNPQFFISVGQAF